MVLEDLLESKASAHGFNRVQTPIFETLDLFTAKSGPGVISQLYAFKDKGERDLTLRPELTAPVMRMIADELRMETKPLRLSYFGQCFRYEEFKTGRYREFFQYGVELIGATGPLAEAEVIALSMDMIDACGLENWYVKIGHVGVLKDILTGLGLSDELLEGQSEPATATAMRFLDKADWDGLSDFFSKNQISKDSLDLLIKLAELEGGKETLSSAREILSKLGIESTNALDELESCVNYVELLSPAIPELQINLCVARGLDYYTGMVFEVHVPALGGEGQVLGGGSYKLLHLFGLPDLDPSCGFGLGFDRIMLALEAQAEASGRAEVVPGELARPSLLAVVPFNVDPSSVLSMVAELRNAGQRVELELKGRKIGKAFSWADGIGADYVVIIGPKDLESGQASVKRLSDGEQFSVSLDSKSILEIL
tara:strand:+ start:15386 stop:16663 length:1278 start_codon:yes stop_codon:yes gene_type:complete